MAMKTVKKEWNELLWVGNRSNHNSKQRKEGLDKEIPQNNSRIKNHGKYSITNPEPC